MRNLGIVTSWCCTLFLVACLQIHFGHCILTGFEPESSSGNEDYELPTETSPEADRFDETTNPTETLETESSFGTSEQFSTVSSNEVSSTRDPSKRRHSSHQTIIIIVATLAFLVLIIAVVGGVFLRRYLRKLKSHVERTISESRKTQTYDNISNSTSLVDMDPGVTPSRESIKDSPPHDPRATLKPVFATVEFLPHASYIEETASPYHSTLRSIDSRCSYFTEMEVRF